MFCATCNLHFPDHLNFCRRCGQPLVRSTSEPVIESTCCTRCGARVVRGENFCQQCGYRLNVKTQDTVVGACFQCGTSWRSGWLFCRTCGLDRDSALTPPVSTPATSVAGSNVVTLVEELPKIEKTKCPKCGADSKPFSRYCESCGFGLGARNTGELKAPRVSQKLKSPGDYERSAPRPPDSIAESRAGSKASPGPATIDQSLTPPERMPPPVGRTERPEITQTKARQGKTVAFKPSVATGNLSRNQGKIPGPPPVTAPASGAQTSVNSRTTRVSGSLIDSVVIPGDSRQRSNRAAIQTIAVVGAFLLLSIALVAWWFFRSRPGPTASPVDQTKAEQTQTLPPAPPDVSPGQPPSIAAPEGMVYVPGGSFRMGRRGGDRFEVPLFSVTIKPFFIDRTEVTNDEYLRFVKATGHRAPAGWPENWKDGVFPEDKLKLPVVNVSWDDANAYAKWAQKRLPTEAEWEFAARGDDGRIYPWGNEWSADRANAGRGDEGRILAVGSFANGASPYGALDMCGNVWEWTAGGLFNYARKSRLIASGKVIRGGAFDVPSERATATYRGVIPPDRMFDKTGFRCARDVK